MKKAFLLMLSLAFSCVVFCQDLREPDFIGESFIISKNNTALPLQKETTKIRTRAGATVYIVGIGKIKSKIQLAECCSKVRTSTKQNLKIVVRAVDNQTDPLAIISLFKFDSKKKKRLAEVASAGTFSGASSNNLDYINFNGKKYGENSYLLTIPSIATGEYGIIVKNPNNLDEKNIIVSTFGID